KQPRRASNLSRFCWKKAASMRNSSVSARPRRARISPISSRTKRSAPLLSWTLPGRFLSLRIWPVCARWASSGYVTGVLGVMRVKAACSPSHFTTGTDDGAVKVDSQTPKTELCDLLIEQFAVEAHQPAQRRLRKLLEPVDHRAVAGNTRQTAEPREQ